MTLTLRDRIHGAVLGAAIGDAMGHPTEFITSFAGIGQRFPPHGVTGFALYWERDGRKFAPYTDDTQMAEVVLGAVIGSRAEGWSLDHTMVRIADGFVEWHQNPQGGHRAPGNACMAGCRELAAGSHWSVAGGATAGGCGSVMRAYPFGLAFHDQPERAVEWAVEHSKMTHRDPIALAACAGMAAAMVKAMAGTEIDEVLRASVDSAGRYDAKTAAMISEAVEEGRSGVPVETTLQRLQGWAAHEAIAAAAFVMVRHPDDIRAALLEAANTPGDSDSIATLVGAMLGARLGIEAIPADWVQDVERSEDLKALADELAGLVE